MVILKPWMDGKMEGWKERWMDKWMNSSWKESGMDGIWKEREGWINGWMVDGMKAR